ncbi:hypothetical protein BK702_01100 [Bacillus thuringiensis serovar cameroun]|nr:hypothetical protein BK702_01100 [Bacillus thuringiensis serovar cameroun]
MTAQKIDEAIQRLARVSEPINFNSVASEAGIAKATLYNNPELRGRVESLRQQQVQTPTLKQIKREVNENPVISCIGTDITGLYEFNILYVL